MGLTAGKERQLEDLYRRHARHARRVVERIVFGRTSEPQAAGAGLRPGPATTYRSAMTPGPVEAEMRLRSAEIVRTIVSCKAWPTADGCARGAWAPRPFTIREA